MIWSGSGGVMLSDSLYITLPCPSDPEVIHGHYWLSLCSLVFRESNQQQCAMLLLLSLPTLCFLVGYLGSSKVWDRDQDYHLWSFRCKPTDSSKLFGPLLEGKTLLNQVASSRSQITKMSVTCPRAIHNKVERQHSFQRVIWTSPIPRHHEIPWTRFF